VSKLVAREVAYVQREVVLKRIENTVYYYSSYEKDLERQGLRHATTLYTTREAAEIADREWQAAASKNNEPPPRPPRPSPKQQTPPPQPDPRQQQSRPLPTVPKQQTPPLPPPRAKQQQTRPLPPEPTPKSQTLGSSSGGKLAALVMDLYRLNVEELHKQWTPRLRPPFEEWLRSTTGDNQIDYVKWLLRKGEIRKDPPQDYSGAERTLTPELLLGLDKTVYAEGIAWLEKQAKASVADTVKSYHDYNKGTQDFWYNVFQWSSVKSPQGPVDRAAVEFSNWPYARDTHRGSVSTRLYLNTTAAETEKVAKDLAKLLDVPECVAIKYAPGTAAGFRRDAIVIYVQGPGEKILSTIGSYQKENGNCFVDQTVRLTGDTGLTGVGIAEHPQGTKSYSDLTSQAVRKAFERAKDETDLPAVLREELTAAGLDPDHPGRLLR
jgi:hypothetical protein